MVRAPCCEKMGLKKGPWSPEEDQILVNFIHKNGHQNWRALPKQAGLVRCGKSCRLRWINYLRPDIKRGNFTKQEEESIFELHEMLGNRWSAIAARLPGRTDNEIKNVWNTHLKKQLQIGKCSQDSKKHSIISAPKCDKEVLENPTLAKFDKIIIRHDRCSSEMSSSLTDSSMCKTAMVVKDEEPDYTSEYFPRIDESFWSEQLSMVDDKISSMVSPMESGNMSSTSDDDMGFWHNLFIRGENMLGLPEF